MRRILLLLLFHGFSMLAQAADIPVVVNKDEEQSQQMCISNAANDCVNTICMNSPDINCTDNCQSEAENTCEESVEE